jgi:hypothetical protein
MSKWFTVHNVMVFIIIPLIGICGLRILSSLDNLDKDMQEVKIQQAIDHEQLQEVRAYMHLRSRTNTNDE